MDVSCFPPPLDCALLLTEVMAIVHGSIIRLHRPDETRTYMVDPKFLRRTDAKTAVALQAMSEGACVYMRDLASKVDSKVTQDMRRFTSETILPILGSEYTKIRNGVHPQFEFQCEDGGVLTYHTLALKEKLRPMAAFGASLTLILSDEEKRTWTVAPAYRTKNDAKIAVAHTFGKEAIEFLRFRGASPPPGHDPYRTNKSEQKAAAAARAQQMTKTASKEGDDRSKRK